MIQVNNLAMSYGERILFENVNLNLSPGQCYGIVGANGSGKSTFLKILSGDIHPKTGNIRIPNDYNLGILKQNHFEYENNKIIDVVLMGREKLWTALQRRDVLSKKQNLSSNEGIELSEVEILLSQLDGYQAESKAANILNGLGIRSSQISNPMSTLSGGYKLRVLLAKCLFSLPDIILLDEPNNHLDIYSIAWLENYLTSFKGIVVIVSHDHNFLNRISTNILDIDYEEIKAYKGNYDSFLKAKKLEREQKEVEIERQEKKQQELQEFYEKFKAKATKARQAVSRKKQLENMDDIHIKRSSRKTPKFNLVPTRPSGQNVLEINNLNKSFDDNHVIRDLSFNINRNDKIAIIGPNGIGKSTLLKILTNNLKADSGKINWGYEVALGYFAQNHKDIIPDGTTPYNWLYNFINEKTVTGVRSILGKMLFSGDDVDKSTESLSGGEAARLLFSKLIAQHPNTLLLDEPTNHLDLESIEALSDALVEYTGTLLFVSHDRYFVEKVATSILELNYDGHKYYQGKYSSFIYSKGEDHLSEDISKLGKKNYPSDSGKKPLKSKLNIRQRRELTKELSRLEKKIKQHENNITELEGKIAEQQKQLETNASSDFKKLQDIMAEKEKHEADLDHEMTQWEEKHTKHEEICLKIEAIDTETN